jgi:hypothetical protein
MVFQSFEIYAKRKKNKERKGCYEKVQVQVDTQITNVKCFILGLEVDAMFDLFYVFPCELSISSSFAQPSIWVKVIVQRANRYASEHERK